MWIFLSIIIPLAVVIGIAIVICICRRERRAERNSNYDLEQGTIPTNTTQSRSVSSNRTKYQPVGSSYEQDSFSSQVNNGTSPISSKIILDQSTLYNEDIKRRTIPESKFTPITLRFHDDQQKKVFKPDEFEGGLISAPRTTSDPILDKIKGSLVGLAIGDALGAPVEFRPYEYLKDNPLREYIAGGTWGLQKGQFTDDTSMALCLANSLISCGDHDPYNQLVQYKWWYTHGFMSSTGECFDIGAATRVAVEEFIRRQDQYATTNGTPKGSVDELTMIRLKGNFDWRCGQEDAAGNGSLMRLAPVPLFFHRKPGVAVNYSGQSSLTTHGDRRARDACRFFGALIVGALRGLNKQELLDPNFYQNHQDWFGAEDLVHEIKLVAQGSYKRKPRGYEDGIRGAGFVVASLEAALWSFQNDDDSFEKGVLQVINLGDDTDTTAAIYGQLAGAYYGYDQLPKRFTETLYARSFIEKISGWIEYKGFQWEKSSIE